MNMSIDGFLAYGQSIGVKVDFTGYVINTNGGITRINEEFFRKAPCAVVRNGITVYVSGDVNVCCHGINKLLRNNNICRNLLAKKFTKSKAKEIREICLSLGEVISECLECDLKLDERL